MKPKDFFNAVSEMREMQKRYLKDRSPMVLAACKRQEKIVDTEIERVGKVVEKDGQLRLMTFTSETERHDKR